MIRNMNFTNFTFLRQAFHVTKRLCYNRTIRMNLKKRLQDARKAKKLGVEEAATKLGLTRVQMWRIEKKPNVVSIDRLYQLAKLYGLEIGALLQDGVKYRNGELPVQVIEMAVEVVQPIAASMTPRPSVRAIKDATIKVVRLIDEQYSANPKAQIDFNQFTMLIKDILKEEEK